MSLLVVYCFKLSSNLVQLHFYCCLLYAYFLCENALCFCDYVTDNCDETCTMKKIFRGNFGIVSLFLLYMTLLRAVTNIVWLVIIIMYKKG